MPIDDTLALISQRLAAKLQATPDVSAAGAAVVRNRYSKGWITLDELHRELDFLGYTDEQIALNTYLAALEFSTSYLDDSLAAIQAAFGKDVLSPDEFISQVTALGMDPDVANLYLQREQLKRAKRAEALTPAQVTSAWSRRILTESAAAERLRNIGYSDADVALLLDLADKTATATVAKLTTSEVLRAYAAGLLSKPDAAARLAADHYAPADVQILLTLAVLQPDTPVRGLSASELVKAQAGKVITDKQFQDRMAQLGYSPADAWILVTLAAKPATADQVKVLSPSQLTQAYQLQYITQAQFQARLASQGYQPADIALLDALSLKAPTSATVATLSAGQVVKAYTLGLIDQAAAETRLQSLNYTSADISLLLQLALVELTDAHLKQLNAAQLLTLLKAGLLDEPTVLSRLESLGYATPDAELLIANALTPTASTTTSSTP